MKILIIGSMAFAKDMVKIRKELKRYGRGHMKLQSCNRKVLHGDLAKMK